MQQSLNPWITRPTPTNRTEEVPELDCPAGGGDQHTASGHGRAGRGRPAGRRAVMAGTAASVGHRYPWGSGRKPHR
jgi:hypothetical protein